MLPLEENLSPELQKQVFSPLLVLFHQMTLYVRLRAFGELWFSPPDIGCDSQIHYLALS